MTGEQNPEADPESTAEHYDKQTKSVEAQANLDAARDRIANPPSAVEARIKHEEELAKRATDAEERARSAEDKVHTATEEAKKEAEAAAAQARQLYDQAKEELHNHQLSMLSGKLDDVLNSRKSPQDQMTEYFAFADQMGEKMGWVKPGTLQPASENPQIALELAKIHIEDAHRQREHEAKLAQDKRDWDLKMIELGDTRAHNAALLAIEEKKTDLLMSAPSVLGAALIKGAMDRDGGGTPVEKKTWGITMTEGESGEVECPNCHIPVGVGPTTTTATCVGCKTPYPVTRLPAKTKEPVPPGEEEE